MLEHLAHPQVLADLIGMGSDNLRGVPEREPDNQQERLITTGWVTGFVDGEGCFSIGLTRQPDRVNRKGYRTGFQVSHDFVVTQGAKSVRCALRASGVLRRRTRERQFTPRQPPRTPLPLQRVSTGGPTERGDPILQAVSVAIGEATRLRELRAVCRADG